MEKEKRGVPARGWGGIWVGGKSRHRQKRIIKKREFKREEEI